MSAICQYTVEQYIEEATSFHTNLAPGVLVGGFMVDAAVKRMAVYEYFDAICETSSCLPDAIQILTPCTIGNGWLRIVNTGRFALALYDKKSGNGVRVAMDASKLDRYPEIRKWFLRLISKREQDRDTLIGEIRGAGDAIFAIKEVTVSAALLARHAPARIAICQSCHEGYLEDVSGICPACRDNDIYL